jgi:serine/threonine protein kinase
METKKIYSSEHGVLDERYVLIKPLDEQEIIFKVKDMQDNKEYALKLFSDMDSYKYEKEINEEIAKANSSSFIRYITSSVGCLIKDQKKEQLPYIILELSLKGDIYSYISCNGANLGLDERNCKILFHKIISVVKDLHKLDIFHRDLKLENFLFVGDNFTVKLCDFGVSTKVPRYPNGKLYFLIGERGTDIYKAPEVYKEYPYSGEKLDVFNLGIILFLLRVAGRGFMSTECNKKNRCIDDLYSLIRKKKYDDYWEEIYSHYGDIELSEEFKKIYVKMVAFDPKERPTLEEIYDFEWMKEIKEIKDSNPIELRKYEDDLIKELQRREEIMNNQKKNNFRTS